MSLKMTEQEREAFLADVHIGVISIEEPGRGPLTAPIWYWYDPGKELWILTGKESRKGKLLQAAKRFSLVAQNEDMPYKYVSVEGPIVEISTPELESHGRPLARRYLGKELGDQYVAGGDGGENILVKMKPERWLTVDYNKMSAI